MRQSLRVGLVIAGIIVCLLLAVAIILPSAIDPNDFKGRISQIFQEKTGRALVFEDDMAVTLVPWIGVETGPVHVADDPAYGEAPFIRAANIEVNVAILPILRGDYHIKRLVLDGLEVNLALAGNGVGNWESLLETLGGGADQDATGGGPAVSVGSIRVTGSAVNYRDLGSGLSYAVRDVDLKTGVFRPGDVTTLSLACGLESKDSPSLPDMKVEAQLTGGARVDAGASLLEIRGLKLGLNCRGPALPRNGLELGLEGDMNYHYAAGRLKLSDLRLSALNAALGGELLLENLATAPGFSGDLRLEETDLSQVMAALDMETAVRLPPLSGDLRLYGDAAALNLEGLDLRLGGAVLAGKVAVTDLGGKRGLSGDLELTALDPYALLPGLGVTPPEPLATGSQGAERLPPLAGTLRLAGTVSAPQLKDMDLRAGPLGLTGSLRHLPGERPALMADLALAETDLRALLPRLGVEPPATRDPEVLGRVALAAKVQASKGGQGLPRRLDVSALTLTLDQTTVTGGLSLTDPAMPAGRFDLKADALDLDRYLPPPAEGATAGNATAADRPDKELLPEDLRAFLADADFSGELGVGRLGLAGMTFTDVGATVNVAKGRVNVEPLVLSLYGGQATGRVRTDLTDASPRTAIALKADRVQVEPLLKDALRKNEGRAPVSGLGELALDVEVAGQTWPEVARSMSGDLAFAVRKGGFHTEKKVLMEAVDELPKAEQREAIKKATSSRTFSELAASFDIGGGQATNQDMTLDGTGFDATGKGVVHLANKTVDYAALVNVPVAPTIPVVIQGPLHNPAYHVDRGRLVGEFLKGVVTAPVDIITSPFTILKGIGEALGGGTGGSPKKTGDAKTKNN